MGAFLCVCMFFVFVLLLCGIAFGWAFVVLSSFIIISSVLSLRQLCCGCSFATSCI